MENMQNSPDAQGALSGKLLSMFDDYEQSYNKTTNNRPTKEEILAKYFTPRSRTEIFRILKPLAGRDYIEKAYFHVVKVNTPSGKRFKKVYCPAHNDARVAKLDANGQPILNKDGREVLVASHCPLCEKHKALLKKQDPSLRGIKKENMTDAQKKIKEKNDEIYKEAVQWEAKLFYIVRGIDKGAEKDGPKFWRFKHNFKKQGIHDKLMPALSSYVQQFGYDFTDTDNGTDLVITVVDAQLPGSDRTYKDVSSIMPKAPTKLHQDVNVIKQWTQDPIIWRDVFKPAKAPQLDTVGVLERIARGVDPYWDDSDQQKKQWVFPDPADAELMERANTRSMNLDASERPENIQLASDLVGKSYDNVSINNVTAQDVIKNTEDAEDIGTEEPDMTPETNQPAASVVQTYALQTPVEKQVDSSPEESIGNEYDDLPF